MKQKLKKWLYVFTLWGIKGALLLCMSVSCKKEPAPEEIPDFSSDPCYTGSCCIDDHNAPSDDYIMIAKFENEPADRDRSTLVFKRGFQTFKQQPDFPQHGIIICWNDINQKKVQGLENTLVVDGEGGWKNTPYKYRVWGRILWARHIIGFTGLPWLVVQIDKIEKIN